MDLATGIGGKRSGHHCSWKLVGRMSINKTICYAQQDKPSLLCNERWSVWALAEVPYHNNPGTAAKKTVDKAQAPKRVGEPINYTVGTQSQDRVLI